MSQTGQLVEWSGREDLNLRPPGPEPDSRAYWNLQKFGARKWLLLNLLRPGRGKQLNFLEVRDSVSHKFTYVFLQGKVGITKCIEKLLCGFIVGLAGRCAPIAT